MILNVIFIKWVKIVCVFIIDWLMNKNIIKIKEVIQDQYISNRLLSTSVN